MISQSMAQGLSKYIDYVYVVPWVWMSFCLEHDFLFKSVLTGCVRLPREFEKRGLDHSHLAAIALQFWDAASSHLAAIAVLGRMGLRPKTAMAARWRQIEPSPPCNS